MSRYLPLEGECEERVVIDALPLLLHAAALLVHLELTLPRGDEVLPRPGDLPPPLPPPHLALALHLGLHLALLLSIAVDGGACEARFVLAARLVRVGVRDGVQ